MRRIKDFFKKNSIICLLIAIIKIQLDFLKKEEKINLDNSKKHAFIMLCADYPNIGDMAIVEAQKKFLQDHLGHKYQIICIPAKATVQSIKYLKKHIQDSDIVTIVGGGNTGNLYPDLDLKRIIIIRYLPNNPIISFPQSVCYTKNGLCKSMFKKECHRSNLYFVARESLSLKKYEELGIKSMFTPDIVFYLSHNKSNNRKGVSFVFRSDKEKEINNSVEKSLRAIIDKKGIPATNNDTCDVEIKDRSTKDIFQEYVNLIAKKELVITDRLHGMIISYITQTPCIVFDNNNHKIKYTYENWLKNGQNFIVLANSNSSSEELEKNVDRLTKKGFSAKKINIQDKYKCLENELKNMKV